MTNYDFYGCHYVPDQKKVKPGMIWIGWSKSLAWSSLNLMIPFDTYHFKTRLYLACIYYQIA
jgi:hypothetical protein